MGKDDGISDLLPGKISEFNEAVQKVNRLADLQVQANQFSIDRNFKGWYDVLCIIYREIYSKLTLDEKTEIENKITTAGKKVVSFYNILEAQRQRLYVSTGNVVNTNSIASLLFELDCKLRALIERAGYGSPDKLEELF